MANGLSITADMNTTRVFECPNCKQTIDTSADRCRFCNVVIDPVQAEAAAAQMSRISRACNDASYLRIAMICGLVFFGWMFLPIIGGVGALGFLFLKYAIPVWTILWLVRFAKLDSDDQDLRKARKFILFIGVPVSALLLWGGVSSVIQWFHHS